VAPGRLIAPPRRAQKPPQQRAPVIARHESISSIRAQTPREDVRQLAAREGSS